MIATLQVLPLRNRDSFHSKSVFRLRFLNSSAKVYSSFTNIFGKDSAIAVQRIEVSYPKSIYSI